ncbi:MAG: putative lipid II flippase FtsW [Bacteriovoracia bacterium]
MSQFNNLKAFQITLGLIILIGIVMVYSSSYIYAKEVLGSSSHFLIRQLTYAILGVAVAFVVSRTKFVLWYKYAFVINWLISLVLIMTFIPSLGVELKGSNRWIQLMGHTLQPGEFAKYSVLLCGLHLFENFFAYPIKQRLLNIFSLIAPMIIIMIQPDFGTFGICIFAIFLSCYLTSFPRKWFFAMVGLGMVLTTSLLFIAPYRVQRVLTYLDPWKDPKNTGFQIIQSYLAFANGSMFGQGIGNSTEKLFYLPEAYNDFIFSVIGEELGFVGVVSVILLFMALIYWGIRLGLQSRFRISALSIIGFVSLIGIQALLNMGVVLGLLPTKGLNLPFISFGGSSLLANFWAVGLIISAYQRGGYFKPQIAESSETVNRYRSKRPRTMSYRPGRLP